MENIKNQSNHNRRSSNSSITCESNELRTDFPFPSIQYPFQSISSGPNRSFTQFSIYPDMNILLLIFDFRVLIQDFFICFSSFCGISLEFYYCLDSQIITDFFVIFSGILYLVFFCFDVGISRGYYFSLFFNFYRRLLLDRIDSTNVDVVAFCPVLILKLFCF